jgi:hypothetical protein
MKNEIYCLFSTLDIPIKLMEQGAMRIEAPSGLISSFVKLDFQARFLHHTTHIEELPSIIMQQLPAMLKNNIAFNLQLIPYTLNMLILIPWHRCS